nr:uncharacterized protein LOC107453629 [Parasteatoda tepidariorum]
MYCALISSNPGKYVLDNETTEVLRKKLLKKNNDPNWTEICNPVDNISVDVLTCHAYKLTKARYTLTNKILTEFHKDVVINSVSQKLLDIYSNDMEKKLKKQDYKELKQNPPRIGF